MSFDDEDDNYPVELKVTGVEKTTEKAVLFKSDKGKFWVPKSQLCGAWRGDADSGIVFVTEWFSENIKFI